MSTIASFLAGGACVEVRIAAVKGSSPREEGAFMLVREGALWGTVGGGQLEYMAIDEARKLLASGETAARQMDVPLGPEIGQCCGGFVTLALTRVSASRAAALEAEEAKARAAMPEVLIFGAGHIGRALAYALRPLPLRARLIDSRAEELALDKSGTEQSLSALPEAEVRAAGAGAAYIVLTHDHALDFLLTGEALDRGDAAYVGMIGSKTKRAKFNRWYEGQSDALVCPMAAARKGDRRPEVIAAHVVAEVLSALEAHAATQAHLQKTKLGDV